MLVNSLFFLKSALVRQKWIFLGALFVLVFLWLVLQHTVNKGVSRSLAEQEASNGLLAHALEDSVVRSFQSVNSSMITLVESLPQLGERIEVENILREQLRTAPQLRSIDLLNAEGVITATVTRNFGSKLSYSCIDRLKNEAMTEFIIGTPKPGRYPNDPFADRTALSHIPFCLPVRDEQGVVQQILIASINPQYFGNLFSSVSDTLHSYVQLYRYDGAGLLGDDQATPNTRALLTQVKETSWGQYRETISGHNYLISYRSTSLLPLITVLVSEENAALASWKHDERMIRLFLLLAAVFTIFAALIIAVLMEKRRLTEGDNYLLSTAIRSTANAIFITNRSGEIHWINKAFTQLTGYSFEEVKGKNPKILNSGCHSKDFFGGLWAAILAGKSWRGELVNRHKEGHTMTVEQTVTPIMNNQGEAEHFIAVHEDMTARKSAEQRALFLADHDPLTSLPNRRYFEHHLYDIFRSKNLNEVSILFIDLDRFKEINDTMGHEAGDALLIHTTDNLQKVLPEQALLARLGGDEFAVLSEGATEHHQQATLAEKIIAAVAQPFHYGDGTFSVTCSVGIAMGGYSATDASMMLRQADLAMYRAKHDGKNTFRFFDEAMDALMKRRVFLQQQLELAVHRETDLSLRFQPQVEAETGRVYGAEALLRWEVGDGEWVSPAEFITLAEETGQILEVGVWLMESLFRQMAEWNAKGLAFGKISMNISSVQLARDTLAQRLLDLLDKFSIPYTQVCVEITETTLMTDSEMVTENLRRLKKAGITLSIDDFGTGYSSMSYLKALDADHLKIDRSFIIGIGVNESDEHIVRATMALAHSLGMETVAEGVDSREQLAFLQKLSCDYIQGYLFAKPLDAADFEAFVEERNLMAETIEGQNYA
ncbi:bifunctional diguanylate cyclase/phosphodiesterase [Oceanospirillum sanctuarii]|uniref:bifunctional diguanylate cyclase/phosphodiesterase n=1 Tax=Oceanospirillum sanctuarii TaxID=1434821 RepID=UPI00111DAFC4|nr:EAL domain-containing protein [Oceanospirillum sanctuarii]